MTTATATQDPEAEEALLSSALAGGVDLDALSEIVTAADFYNPHNGEVWSAIQRVAATGTPPDPISVRTELDTAGIKHDPVRLLNLVSRFAITVNATFYAQQIADAATRRRMQAAAVRIHHLAASPQATIDEVREHIRGIIDDATDGPIKAEFQWMRDILPSVLAHAEAGGQRGLSTPWPEIDRLIGGIVPGRLVVIGARPGVGKSLMGTNLARHVAKVHDKPALVASIEMNEDEVGMRILARDARIDLRNLIEGTVTEQEWDLIRQRYESLEQAKIAVLDKTEQTPAVIAKTARAIRRLVGELPLVVVDYLQLINQKTPGRSRVEELGAISRDLKILARESQTCVVAMVQLNRGVVGRNDPPRSSDIRESGSIEQDADQVILLHQPDPQVPEIDAIVDKNRWGPRGVARLQVWGHYAQISSPTHAEAWRR